MRHPTLVARSLAAALTLAVTTAGIAVAAFQVVELSAEKAPSGRTVTIRAGMSGRLAGTDSGELFLIGPGTFGDAGPETMSCDTLRNAVEVGAIHWQTGTV